MAFIIIADLFPPAERGKYQGFVGAVFGIASVLGPWVGGLLTDHGGAFVPGIAGWRWVFYVNVPFGALALWFIVRRMPPLLPQGEKQRLDYASALLLIGRIGAAGAGPATRQNRLPLGFMGHLVIGKRAGAGVPRPFFLPLATRGQPHSGL